MTDKVLRVGISVKPFEHRVGVSVKENTNRVAIKVSEGNGGGTKPLPYYDGDYEVTPRKQEIVLATKNKSMEKDVTVFQIPYSIVKNTQGGLTVTIGLE